MLLFHIGPIEAGEVSLLEFDEAADMIEAANKRARRHR